MVSRHWFGKDAAGNARSLPNNWTGFSFLPLFLARVVWYLGGEMLVQEVAPYQY